MKCALLTIGVSEKSNCRITSVTKGALFTMLLWVSVFSSSSLAQAADVKNEPQREEGVHINEAPYISTYYLKPIVRPGEEVRIDFYITDYYQREYKEGDTSETFTVRVRVEGRDEIVKTGLRAGDHSVGLGSFQDEGEVKFSIQGTDRLGRNSHELFNFFLVRKKTVLREYVMTKADLATYGIKNTDNYEVKKLVRITIEKPNRKLVKEKMVAAAAGITAPTGKYIVAVADTEGTGKPGNWWKAMIVKHGAGYDHKAVGVQAQATQEGLQKFLDEKAAAGFKRVKLLPGVYRVDHSKKLYIPSEMTVDMNGATLKLHPFTGCGAFMVSLNNTFDSHLENGVIEGDYYAHDYANSPHNSEWVCGVTIEGGARYSSYRNLTIKDITGYGGSNGIGKTRDEKLGYTYGYPKQLGEFVLGDIDRKTGASVESSIRTSSGFVGIPVPGVIDPKTNVPNPEYLQVGLYLGYQGNPCGTSSLLCHFYTEDKTFLKSVDAYLYRRVRIPTDARKMRVTILGTATPKKLRTFYFRVPTHCAFKNIRFVNNRCVGLAPAAMNDMLVEKCEFTRCGQSSAKCAYDAEDGWDGMQDVFFKDLRFYKNPHNELLTCGGYNFVAENITGKVHIWGRTNSFVLRNSKQLTSLGLGASRRSRTGYYRVHDNIIKGAVGIKGGGGGRDSWKIVLRNTSIEGKITSPGGKFINCEIQKGSLDTGEFEACYIHDMGGENRGGGTYRNCKIENVSGNMHATFDVANCTITNWHCNAGGQTPKYFFRDSRLNDFSIKFNYWFKGAKTLFDSCVITSKGPLLKLPHYSMKRPISILNSEFVTTGNEGIVYFYDDRGGDGAGKVVEQQPLTLRDNILELGASPHAIKGLSEKARNQIRLVATGNTMKPEQALLYNPEAKKSDKIILVEE